MESFISSATFLLFSCIPLYFPSLVGSSHAADRSALTASSLADARLAIHWSCPACGLGFSGGGVFFGSAPFLFVLVS